MIRNSKRIQEAFKSLPKSVDSVYKLWIWMMYEKILYFEVIDKYYGIIGSKSEDLHQYKNNNSLS